MSIKKVADILMRMEQSKATKLLACLDELDEQLAGRVRDELFLFTDLGCADDRGLQNLLQEVDQSVLAMALRGAEAVLVDKILTNLSPRVAACLREEAMIAGPIAKQRVEIARQVIVQTARRLQSEGRLIIIGKGDAGKVIH